MSVDGVRFAHTEGRVSLAYGRSGKKIYTLGQDGELRIWTGIDDDDCENIVVGEEGFAVAVASERIFVSTSETNTVQALTLDGDSDGIITKFTADVTCLDAIDSGKLVASGSADMTIKVSDTENFKDKDLVGHKGPILSVALDPLKTYVAASSCDGTIGIWDLSSLSQVKSFDWVPKSNDVSNSSTVCSMKFSRSGSHLAVPKGDSVVTLFRETWNTGLTLTTDKLTEKETFTCAEWSQKEQFIIAGTSKGNVCVWSKDGSLRCFLNTERKYAVCALAANPSNEDEAAFADSQGYWGMVSGLGTKTDDAGDTDRLSQEELVELFNEDEDDENSFSISKIQQETGFSKDDEGHLFHADRLDIPSSRPGSSISSHAPANLARIEKSVRLQAPFQPGASPQHFNFRFLVYNHVGVVKTIQENNIDVDFHDSSTHYNLFFRNPENFTMAALTDKILVLARHGDDESPGKFTVHNFKSSESNNEWSIDLPDEEAVLGVAAGEGWVAVTTSNNYLRLFSSWGIQREVVSLSGPLVSMVGSGQKLFVCVNSAHPLPDQQCFSYYLMDIDFRKGLSQTVGPVQLPVTPGTELYWVGISDTNLPVTTDTEGIVRMLVNNAWLPVCSSKASLSGKADTFYVTCVDQIDNQIRGIKCKGARYPLTIPKPSPSRILLEMPFTVSGEKGALEQRLIFSSIMKPVKYSGEDLQSRARQEELECLMKLFALACRSDQEDRALEICKLMSDVESVQMAIQYAAKIKRVGLASKLSEVALGFTDAKNETDECQEDEESIDPNGREESQDMFADSQDSLDNPLLAVKSVYSPAYPDSQPPKQRARNPFAVRSTDNRESLDKNEGIVFDSTSNVMKTATKKTYLFTKTSNKKTPSVGEKENKDKELKGFSLFMAEEQFPGTPEESQQTALAKWKSLDKSVKESYKSPRIPNSNGKRKRSEESPAQEKKSKSSISNKLSGFAFGNS